MKKSMYQIVGLRFCFASVSVQNNNISTVDGNSAYPVVEIRDIPAGVLKEGYSKEV